MTSPAVQPAVRELFTKLYLLRCSRNIYGFQIKTLGSIARGRVTSYRAAFVITMPPFLPIVASIAARVGVAVRLEYKSARVVPQGRKG